MKTSSAKSKGRELQKYVAKMIRDLFGLADEDVVSRPMGSPGTDIMLSSLALSKLPISFECKNTKTFPSLSALVQSKANAKGKNAAAVVWKPPRKGMSESIVYMNLNDFLLLIKEMKNE